MWDDIIGEYEGLRSVECAWNLSRKCYDATKGGCYLCLSMICGPCLAFCAGIHFACLSFQVVILAIRFDFVSLSYNKNIGYCNLISFLSIFGV